jgi:hypothetical protein
VEEEGEAGKVSQNPNVRRVEIDQEPTLSENDVNLDDLLRVPFDGDGHVYESALEPSSIAQE